MYPMRFTILLLLQLLVCLSPTYGAKGTADWTQAWKRHYTRIQDDEAAAVVRTQVWDAVEGADGYMFFATNNGLCVWDGVRWRRYQNPSNNILRALLYDRQRQRIYSAGVNEFGYWEMNRYGLFDYTVLFRNENFRRTNYEFWRIVAPGGSDEGIYFESHYRIYRYDPTLDTTDDARGADPALTSFDPRDQFRYMFLDRDRICYQDGTSLYQLESRNNPRYVCDVNNRIIDLFRNSRGERIAILEYQGAVEIDEQGRIRPLDAEANRRLGRSHVICCSPYDESHILVGTTRGDLFLVNLDTGKIDDTIRYDNEDVSDPAILSVTRDSHNNIWMGMNAGIIRVASNIDEFYIRDRQLGTVNSMLECRDGSLLLGTTKGLFRAAAGEERISPIDGPLGPVWEIAELNGRILVLHDRGVFTLEDNRLIMTMPTNGALHVEPFTSDCDWFLVGEYNGLSLMHFEEGRFVPAGRIENHHIYSNHFRIDAADRVWLPISTRELACLTLSADRHSVTSLKSYPLLTDESKPGYVFLSQVGPELIVCGGNTAYRINYEDDTLQPDETASRILQLCSDRVRELVQYDNNFWYISDSDIGYIKRDREEGLVRYAGIFEAIPAEKRLNGTLMYVGDAMAIGFSGGAGFFAGHGRVPEDPRLGSAAALDAAGEELYYDKSRDLFRIPSSMSLLRIYPVNLGAGRTIEYRIDDTPWRTERIDDYLQFISLPMGRHTISLRTPGQEDASRWITLTIYMQRPWYISFTAIILYILTIVGLTLAGDFYVRWLRRQQQRHREELEHLEQENLDKKRHIQELETEYRSLEKENEQLNSDLKDTSKKLANITIEKISRNNILDSIRSEMETLAAADSQARVRGAANRIIRLIDGREDDTEHRQQLEHYFNIIYDGMLDKLITRYPQLSKTDLKLCVYIKLNLSTKEIAELMNISPRSVEMGRYRLRKKLNLDPNESIHTVLQKL